MLKTKKETDKRITLLQLFGILFVALGHTGDGVPLFSSWFPYSSFHMALFIFISGYLYKEQSETQALQFVGRKIKSLVIPLYAWYFVYAIFWKILNYFDLLRYGASPTINNFLIYPWTYGPRYGITEASWFIATLFLIHIINVPLRKLFGIGKCKIKEYIYLIVLTIMGILAVIKAREIGGLPGEMSQLQSMTIKVGFLFPFYQIGHLMKKEWEKSLDSIPNTVYMATLMGGS